VGSAGRQDRAAADAEMLALALEATTAFGVSDVNPPATSRCSTR
jgi:ATP phosphoribosyltransferase regulatory subunit